MNHNAILAPAAVLVLWTLVMLFWMAATRLPVLAKMGGLEKLPPGGRGQNLDGVAPDQAQWKAHNYMHLVEQPTLFYAVVGILALTGATGALPVAFAWAYVALRIVHSLWQATVNVVRVRFMLFAVSSLCLLVLAVIALMATLS